MVYDKIAAVKSWRRIPEWVLIGSALCGGWPAIFLAALPPIRHKSTKKTFRNKLFLATFCHLVLFIGSLWLVTKS